MFDSVRRPGHRTPPRTDLHGLGNLALLQRDFNSKLNNAVFALKRERILSSTRMVPTSCPARVTSSSSTTRRAPSQQLSDLGAAGPGRPTTRSSSRRSSDFLLPDSCRRCATARRVGHEGLPDHVPRAVRPARDGRPAITRSRSRSSSATSRRDGRRRDHARSASASSTPSWRATTTDGTWASTSCTATSRRACCDRSTASSGSPPCSSSTGTSPRGGELEPALGLAALLLRDATDRTRLHHDPRQNTRIQPMPGPIRVDHRPTLVRLPLAARPHDRVDARDARRDPHPVRSPACTDFRPSGSALVRGRLMTATCDLVPLPPGRRHATTARTSTSR